MAATAVSATPKPFLFSLAHHHHKRTLLSIIPLVPNKQSPSFYGTPNFALQRASPALLPSHHLSGRSRRHPVLVSPLSVSPAGLSDQADEDLSAAIFEEEKPLKTFFLVLLWASVSLALFAFAKDAKAAAAAADSIRASSFGVKVASALRGSGWPDEAVVFALATLPVIELRGAIPVGYWMQLNPTLLTVLSVLGNMVPVPFIILYLKKLANFLAGKNQSASRFLDMLFKNAKEKAGPVEEFQWLGLMLFVALPFPGTGAWTGAIIASVLDMPFWSGVSANFFGVVLAGLLVNLLVNLGLKYAIVTGIILFLISTFMWSVLRSLTKSFRPRS